MRLHSHSVRIALLGLSLLGGMAWAEDPRNYGNLRVGVSTWSRHPTLCLELSPHEMLSFDACGTGSGFLHHDSEPELVHFRTWVKLATWKTDLGWLQPRLGAGFAELQVGDDSGGFFFSGVGPARNETAGPELGASLRLLFPAFIGMELVGEVGVNATYFYYAPQLIQPQSSLQPGASFSVGFGF
jgi:hypothetical protein